MTTTTATTTVPRAAVTHPALRTATRVAAILLPVVVLAIAAWQYRWMSDDGFINLRIVHNLGAGHGPVFNAGERVEASTSPLWVGVLFLADVVLPLRLEWVAVLTGIALTLAGLTMMSAGAARLHERDTREWLVPAGAVVLIAIAPSWKFASSGLENGLTVAWIGGCVLALAGWAREPERRLALGTAVLLGLGPLVRPELTILTLALLGVVTALERGASWRRRIALVAVAFAVPVLYQIFRMGYYAALVPNSALAKEAARPYWSAGWTYLRHAVNPYWLWIPLAVLALGAYLPLLLRGTSPRTRWTTAAFAIAGLLDALYIVRVGGDFMQARLLLPALTMVCAPVAVIPLRRATAAALLVVPWAVVAMATLRSGDDAPQAYGPGTRNAVTLADFGFEPGGPALRWFDGSGVWFIDHRLPGTPSSHDPTVSNYGIGVEGYALRDTYLLDLLGLGDAFTSHLRLDRRGTVAHEKPLPFPWIVARTLQPGTPATAADFRLPPLFFARPLDRPANQSFPQRVADARVALQCAPIREFLDHVTKPLTVGQFFDNLGSAPANHSFRIPPEPREARRRLC